MIKVFMVTKNQYKINAMRKVLEKFDINIECKNIEVPEIQADDCKTVAAFSSKYASNILKKPVLKADAGIFIDALNGFPGIYTSQLQKKLGVSKLLKLLEGESNRKATIVYALAYCEPKKEPKIFVHKTEGVISHSPKGSSGMLIDFIFIPKGETRTMGELRDEDPNLRQKYWGNTEERFAKWLLRVSLNR